MYNHTRPSQALLSSLVVAELPKPNPKPKPNPNRCPDPDPDPDLTLTLTLTLPPTPDPGPDPGRNLRSVLSLNLAGNGLHEQPVSAVLRALHQV